MENRLRSTYAGFGTEIALKSKLTSYLCGDEEHPPDHFVQFYEDDEFLLDLVSNFISAGFARGDTCIIVSTKAHREGLDKRWRAANLDLAAFSERGEYIWLDTDETLAQFMVDGLPNQERFIEVVGGRIALASRRRRRVRVFGEMVTLLWMRGNRTAAIRLEEFWNTLYDDLRSFSLMCAYPMRIFAGETYGAEFLQICQRHSHVFPDENYTNLTSQEERLRIIAQLQQKASSLEVEIAERRAVEERLRISENRYRRLFEESRDGILMVDPDTYIILDANPSIRELLGRTREQLLGRKLWQIKLFQDHAIDRDALRELQEKHYICYESLSFLSGDGRHRDVELLLTLYPVDARHILQCNVRDITERRQLEARKDEFIGLASHELKTPVTSLKGFTSLLKRRLTSQGNEKELYFLVRMEAQITRLTRLINDLLDLSRVQTGQLVYQEESFEMDTLLQEVIEDVQGTTQTHHLSLEGRTQAVIVGDRDRIGQVLINLLNNAIKYSPEADSIWVRVSTNAQDVLVSVQDFGIGIAREHQQKIFERFYQVADLETKTYPGLGMGLYISYQIIKRHGGQLWAESEKGEGTTFHFTLPLVRKQESKASK